MNDLTFQFDEHYCLTIEDQHLRAHLFLNPEKIKELVYAIDKHYSLDDLGFH